MSRFIIAVIVLLLIATILGIFGFQYFNKDKIDIKEFLFPEDYHSMHLQHIHNKNSKHNGFSYDQIAVTLDCDADLIDVDYFGKEYVSEIYALHEISPSETYAYLRLHRNSKLNQLFCAIIISQIPGVICVNRVEALCNLD